MSTKKKSTAKPPEPDQDAASAPAGPSYTPEQAAWARLGIFLDLISSQLESQASAAAVQARNAIDDLLADPSGS